MKRAEALGLAALKRSAKIMSAIEVLVGEQFFEHLDAYLDSNLVTQDALNFESSVGQRFYDRVVIDWTNGWDFEVADEFFEGRGVSILIQNELIAWHECWDWLVGVISGMPRGAIINFEVWNNIHGGVMDASEPVLRRVVTSDGIIEEGE